MPSKGWFHTEGREGDRTIEQQMQGLSPLWPIIYDKSVLDIGCAEGLISVECIHHGARHVRGIEIVPGHVDVARSLSRTLPYGSIAFQVADANSFVPSVGCQYDVVLMLAILHKLRDPVACCKRFAEAATEMCVIRLPPETAPTVVDSRSGSVPFDINAAMEQCGFVLERVTLGHLAEWTGYYRRVNGMNDD